MILFVYGRLTTKGDWCHSLPNIGGVLTSRVAIDRAVIMHHPEKGAALWLPQSATQQARTVVGELWSLKDSVVATILDPSQTRPGSVERRIIAHLEGRSVPVHAYCLIQPISALARGGWRLGNRTTPGL